MMGLSISYVTVYQRIYPVKPPYETSLCFIEHGHLHHMENPYEKPHFMDDNTHEPYEKPHFMGYPHE